MSGPRFTLGLELKEKRMRHTVPVRGTGPRGGGAHVHHRDDGSSAPAAAQHHLSITVKDKHQYFKLIIMRKQQLEQRSKYIHIHTIQNAAQVKQVSWW